MMRVHARRAAVAAALAVMAMLIAVTESSATRRSVPRWRTQAVQSNLSFAADPIVAVARSGRTVVGWSAGDPGAVCFDVARVAPCGRPSHLRMMAVAGTLPGRLGKPQLLAALATNVMSSPRVAVAGDGRAYAVWQNDKRGDWVVAVAAGGRFSAPHPLGIPPRAQLQELAGAGDGPVAAAWLQYGVHSAPVYRYALLRPDGTIGQTITIAHLGSPLQNVEFAINDSGKVLASWVNSGKPFGGTRISAVICTTAGRCSRRRAIHFPQPVGQSLNVTATLSDGGTATIMTSGFTDPTPPATFATRFGLQAVVSRDGGPFRSFPQISATAQHQVSGAVGAHSAVALFNVGGIPIKTIAWSRLTASGFTAPRVLDREEVGPGLVATGNPEGDSAFAWIDAPLGLVTDTSYSIHAALGSGASLSAPQTIAPGADRVGAGYLAGGIDGHGDAILVWDEFIDSQSRGVFASVGQP
jgi:hypothetical protein